MKTPLDAALALQAVTCWSDGIAARKSKLLARIRTNAAPLLVRKAFCWDPTACQNNVAPYRARGRPATRWHDKIV